jgi:transposase
MTSGIIGIDDWAFKKGQTYGTIIVDLYHNKVVDLLPDREAATVSQWLKGHREVKVISRDRGGPYSKGGREGAPQAIQVADRFHLLMNLGEATKKMFQSMGKELAKSFTLYNNSNASKALPPATGIISLYEKDMSTTTNLTVNSNPELLLRFNKVKELKDKGYTIRAISRSVGITRITIRKYLSMDFLPKKTGSRSTNFDAFQQYLLHETQAGKLYKDLHADIVRQGFNGSYTQFCSNMNILLKSCKIIRAIHKPDPAIVKTWSAGKLSFLLQKEPGLLTADDKKFLDHLCRKYPVVEQTAKHGYFAPKCTTYFGG